MKKLFLISIMILSALVFWGCYEVDTSTGPTINYSEISGALSGTLSLSGSPYAITADSYVPAGETWKIEPGVEVRFSGFYRLTVEGVIEAVGSPDQQIIFGSTFNNNSNDRGNWEGILFENPDQSSIFEFCTIEDGATFVPEDFEDFAVRGAVHCLNSSPVFRNCLLIENGFNAIYAEDNSAPLIDGCTITENAFSGIKLTDASHPVIKNCIIVSNDDYGIVAELYTSSAPRVEYCNIWDNFTTDVYGVDFDTTYWSGIISLDPAFTDPAIGNYNLEPHSPCIDAGDPDGIHDPDGSKRDIGAYYYDQSNLSELRNNISEKWDVLTTQYSPYEVNADIWIGEGDTLVIEPGVIIEINSSTELRFSFNVYGTLIALGTANDPIIIRSRGVQDEAGNIYRWKGDWDGFVFHGNSSAELEYLQVFNASDIIFGMDIDVTNCYFKDNKNPVYVENQVANFEFCVFQDNGSAGLNLVNLDNQSNIKHCVFLENQGYGILCQQDADPMITNNLFLHNTTHGIKCTDFSNAHITNNTIVNNEYYGIMANNNSDPNIRNNIIYENNKGGIVCDNASYPIVNYNDVYYNSSDSTMIVNQQTGDTTYVIDDTGLDFDNCPNQIGEMGSSGFDTYMNFSENPLFAEFDNWTLGSGSPCIDAGDPAALYNDPDQTINDLGAYGGPDGNWSPPGFIEGGDWYYKNYAVGK